MQIYIYYHIFEPYEARAYFDDDSLTTHNSATKRVIDEIYKNLDETRINILVAHTFVAGGLETDSEREISVGTVENVAVEIFENLIMLHLVTYIIQML